MGFMCNSFDSDDRLLLYGGLMFFSFLLLITTVGMSFDYLTNEQHLKELEIKSKTPVHIECKCSEQSIVKE
jgi:hypothetical protein